jgi:serine/threonine protein kinase
MRSTAPPVVGLCIRSFFFQLCIQTSILCVRAGIWRLNNSCTVSQRASRYRHHEPHFADVRRVLLLLCAYVAVQIVEAISLLHARGIVYRSIAPEAVLLDETGHIRLTDFSAAKVCKQSLTSVLLLTAAVSAITSSAIAATAVVPVITRRLFDSCYCRYSAPHYLSCVIAACTKLKDFFIPKQ